MTTNDDIDRDLRRELIEQAGQLIAERGEAAVSLREVARRAGASHAAPGHHFGDKRGLLTAVAASTFDRFQDDISTSVEKCSGSELDRLEASGIAYVEFARLNWELFSFMFRRDCIDIEDSDYQRAARCAMATLVDAVASAKAAGWANQRDLDDLVQLCWALAHGFAALNAAGTAGAQQEVDAIGRLLRIQLEALGR